MYTRYVSNRPPRFRGSASQDASPSDNSTGTTTQGLHGGLSCTDDWGNDVECPPGQGIESGGDIGPLGWTAAGFVTTGLTAELIYELFKQAIDVRWDAFPMLDDDRIEVSFGSGGNGIPATELATLTVGVTLGPNVAWWKAAELYNARAQLLGSAWCKRDEGVVSNTTTVRMADLAGGFLVLKKAKMFGVHTAMYVLRWESLVPHANQSIGFFWSRD
jgi:hypothetical protein